MPRRPHEFTAKVKVEAFKRAGGRCEECTAKLMPGGIEYDHRVPLAMGGESTLDNCTVLCRACHAGKTAKTDIPAIAKSNRIRAKHLGAKAPSRHPLPGSKASKWKRKLDGTVVLR